MSVRQRVELGATATAQSFGFLNTHKRLFIFPILSVVASLAVIALVAGLVFEVALYTNFLGLGGELWQVIKSGQNESGTDTESMKLLSLAGTIAMFLLSVCLYFVSTFFNVALSASALSIFDGKPIGFARSLATATRRLGSILGWSILSATIGLISTLIDRKGNILIDVLSILAGFAWSVATLFVIPIIASKEKTGAISAVKESVRLMRADWGSAETSRRGSFRVLLILVILPLVLIVPTHMNIGARAATDLGFVLLPFLVIYLLLVSTVFTITRSVLFYYATKEGAPQGFESEMLRSTIALKKSRKI